MNKSPQIGLGIALVNGNKILLGKRKNSSGEGQWNMPGGHLEFMESPEMGATREVFEETGIKLEGLKFWTITNDIFASEQKHYLTIWFYAFSTAEAKIMEPDKCEGWQWFEWDNLPANLFLPEENLFNSGIKLPTN